MVHVKAQQSDLPREQVLELEWDQQLAVRMATQLEQQLEPQLESQLVHCSVQQSAIERAVAMDLCLAP